MIPEYQSQVTVRLPEILRLRLEEFADETNTKLSDVVRQILERAMRLHESTKV